MTERQQWLFLLANFVVIVALGFILTYGLEYLGYIDFQDLRQISRD